MTRLSLRLWPQRYVVARLTALPGELGGTDREDPPVCLVVGHGEISLLAPEDGLAAYREQIEEISEGWRAVTLDAVFPLDTVGVVAVVSRALAEARVPVMVFSSFETDHLLVPEAMLGRAMATLGQVKLAVDPTA